MKNIDTKSLVIGVLLTSTIFLGVAAVVPKDTGSKDDLRAWDPDQQWAVYRYDPKGLAWKTTDEGEQPFAMTHRADGSTKYIWTRKRTK